MKQVLLSAGDILNTSNGYKVTVGKKLGEGATALVYTAERSDNGETVAVKVSKPGMKAQLEDEWNVLNKVLAFYRRNNKELISPIPYYNESDNKGSLIVMEFLPNSAMQMLLDGEHFSEQQILSIAGDLFEFLEILHSASEIKLSYPDFKADNLRLKKKDQNEYQLRILDLGGLAPVSSPADYKCKIDVLTGGVYLFALFSEYTLQLMGGELNEDVETALKTEMFQEKASWGMLRYFERLLCRVPEFRLTSAEQAAHEARDLLGLWTMSEAELLKQAIEHSSKAKQIVEKDKIGERNDLFAKARMEFDIFVRRKGDEVPQSRELSDGVRDAMDGTSFLNLGKVDLKHGEYEAAIEKFRMGETFESYPSFFRRWRYLAQWIERAQGNVKLADAETISNLFEDKDRKYKEVIEKLKSMSNVAEKEKAVLEAEANIYSAYEAGFNFKRKNDYPSAIKEFEVVEGLLKNFSVDDQASIKKEHRGEENSGDPVRLIADCHTLENELQKFKDFENKFNELKEKFSPDTVPTSDELSEFVANGKYASSLPQHAVDLLARALETADFGYISFAADILYWPVPSKSDKLRSLYGAVRKLSDAYLYVDSNRPDDLLEVVSELAVSFQKETHFAKQFGNLLWTVAEKFSCDELGFWNKLSGKVSALVFPVEVAKRNGKNLSDVLVARAKEVEAKLRMEKADYFAQAETFLYVGKLNQDKLRAHILAFSYFDAKEFFTDNKKRLAIADKFLTMVKKQLSADESLKFNELQAELERQKKRFGLLGEKTAPSVSAQNLQEHRNSLGNVNLGLDTPEREGEFFRLLADCFNYVRGDNEEHNKIVQAIIDDGMAKLKQRGDQGLNSWKAWQKYQTAESGQLKKIETDFQQEQLEIAFKSANSLPPEVLLSKEGADLYIRMLHTERFEKWVSEPQVQSALKNYNRDANVLGELQKFAELGANGKPGIPKAYYQRHGIDTYLNNLGRTELLKQMGFDVRPAPSKSGMQSPKVYDRRLWAAAAFIAVIFIAVVVWQHPFFSWPAIPRPTDTPAIAPSPADTPTATPPPTNPPTATVSPTALPTSTYIVSEAAVTPGLYMKAQTIWELPAFVPCTDSATPTPNPVATPETALCTGVDAPVEKGNYMLYFSLDPSKLNVNESQPKINFEAQLESADDSHSIIPLTPTLGSSQIQLASLVEIQGYVPPWPKEQIWMGSFEPPAAGTFKIKVVVQNDSATFKTLNNGVSVLYLARLDDAYRGIFPAIDPTYQLVNILDLSNFFNFNSKSFSLSYISGLALTPVPTNSMWSDSIVAPKGSLLSAGVLDAGSYKLLYHVANNQNPPKIKLHYGLAAQGAVDLSTPNVNGEWADYDFVLNGDGQVVIDVAPDPTVTNSFFDVILIYKKQ